MNGVFQFLPVFQSVFQLVFQSMCFVFMGVFQCSSIFTRAYA